MSRAHVHRGIRRVNLCLVNCINYISMFLNFFFNWVVLLILKLKAHNAVFNSVNFEITLSGFNYCCRREREGGRKRRPLSTRNTKQ